MKIKSLVALGVAAAMTLSVNAIADDGNIVVNGKSVNGNVYTENGVNYVPLRSVSEALGFEVEWNGANKSVAISNMPQYVTMTVGQDGYTLARTAPMPLGAAPIIKDSTTYVPTAVFDQLLDYVVENEDDTVAINDKVANEREVSVAEISEDGFLVNDEVMGEVMLIISDDTVIIDEAGVNVKAEDIKVGDVLTVEYSDVMTASLPPINNPVKIVVAKSNTETTTEATTETTTVEASSETTTEVDSTETTTEETTVEATEETTEETTAETTTVEE